MDNLTPLQKFYYRLLGYVFYSAYWTNSRRFLGGAISRYIKWAPVVLLFASWVNGWPEWSRYLFVSLFVFIRLIYWYAHRVSYNTFVPDKAVNQTTLALNSDALLTLKPNKRVPVQATGFFSVRDRELFSLLRPAQYWQVPLGDHVVMVEHLSGRYLYQFFNAEGLQQIEKGWLIFGPQPQEALAVTFLTEWGPEFAENNTTYNIIQGRNAPPAIQRRLFFSFADNETQQAVWHNLIADARRVRE